MNKILWKAYAIYSYYAWYRLKRILPKIDEIIHDYGAKSATTGTKYPTLYKSVRSIIKTKPRFILESGTGTSTLVLAELVLSLQDKDPNYCCKIISMESIQEWYDIAVAMLPKKYQEVVEIRLGEREKYDYSIFRGYVHSNIPKLPYEFVLLDGPSYNDENGSSTCMDAIKVRQMSEAETINCVIDTRNSTVFMMQKIFGLRYSRYYPFMRTCLITMKKIKATPRLDSKSFTFDINGKLSLKVKSFKN